MDARKNQLTLFIAAQQYLTGYNISWHWSKDWLQSQVLNRQSTDDWNHSVGKTNGTQVQPLKAETQAKGPPVATAGIASQPMRAYINLPHHSVPFQTKEPRPFRGWLRNLCSYNMWMYKIQKLCVHVTENVIMSIGRKQAIYSHSLHQSATILNYLLRKNKCLKRF